LRVAGRQRRGQSYGRGGGASYGTGESDPKGGGEAEAYGAAHGGLCGGLGAQRWPNRRRRRPATVAGEEARGGHRVAPRVDPEHQDDGDDHGEVAGPLGTARRGRWPRRHGGEAVVALGRDGEEGGRARRGEKRLGFGGLARRRSYPRTEARDGRRVEIAGSGASAGDTATEVGDGVDGPAARHCALEAHKHSARVPFPFSLFCFISFVLFC
jgi:hypothetical protein